MYIHAHSSSFHSNRPHLTPTQPLLQVCRDALDLQPEDPTRGNELITMVMQVRTTDTKGRGHAHTHTRARMIVNNYWRGDR